MKTVTISFQLRVPTPMSMEEIKNFVHKAITSEPGCARPDSHGAQVKLYKQRIEVFMP